MHVWGPFKIKAVFENIHQQLDDQNQLHKQLTLQIESLQKELQQLQERVESSEREIRCKEEEIARKNDELKEWKDAFCRENWMTTFSYDSMISMLQLDAVEQQLPGNRARLVSLKNTHRGESCFVVGNGPSLTPDALTRLKEEKIFSFGSNRINAIFPQTDWRPDVWCASDLDYIRTYHKEIAEMQGFVKLMASQALLQDRVLDKNTIYFPFIQAERESAWFNADIVRGMYYWGTVTCKLINLAVYMGFTQIFLLGVDHSWPMHRDENGVLRGDTDKQSHFSADYMEKKLENDIRENLGDMEKRVAYITRSYHDVGWFCNQYGVKIYNATAHTGLKEFPCVTLDWALQKIKEDAK